VDRPGPCQYPVGRDCFPLLRVDARTISECSAAMSHATPLSVTTKQFAASFVNHQCVRQTITYLYRKFTSPDLWLGSYVL
jgi:hypothetical protein